MTANVPFQELSHQTVHGPAGRAHELQNIGAVLLLNYGSFQGLDLAADAPDSGN